MKKRTSGFTLIELMIVVTIVGILMAIGLVSFQNASKNARNARRKGDIETVRQALVLYRSDTGCYPNSAGANSNAKYAQLVLDLSTVVGSQYLSSPLPQDPRFTIDGSSYQYTPSGACATGSSAFTLTATLETSPVTYYNATNP